MKKPLRKFAMILLCLLFFLTLISASEPNNLSTQRRTVKAAVIVCKGMIDDGLYKSIQRKTNIALDAGAMISVSCQDILPA